MTAEILDKRRVSITRPPELARKVAAHYPDIEKESEMVRTVYREIARMHETGTMPEQIFSDFRDLVRAGGGRIPVALYGPGGDDLVADGGGDQALRLYLNENDDMEVELLPREQLEELSKAELVDRLDDLQDAIQSE